MTAIPTLNATVAEIEAMLRAGSTVQEVATYYSEPAVNVYAVQRSMQRDDKPATPTPPASTRPGSARPLASVPSPSAAAASAQPSIDALVSAAARSTSKRTKALGAKLADLASVVRQRLTEEREAAEKAETDRREREAAAAEVERLEKQLAEARAKAGIRRGSRGGSGSVSPNGSQSKAGRATAEKYAGTSLCSKGCGRDLTNAPGPRAKHEKNCGGAK